MDYITVTMTRDAYSKYLRPVKEGGAGFKDKSQLIKYLNDIGGYLGRVTNVVVEEEQIKTNYTDKVASDILYQ